MKNSKKFLSMAMAAAMALSCGSALAADITTAGSTGSVPVELTAEAATFKVTVPTTLPISVDGDGVASYASDCKIVNGSYGQVNVKDIAVEAQNGWALKAFDEAAEDGKSGMTTEKVGTQKIAMAITPAGGAEEKLAGDPVALAFVEGDWAVMDGVNTTDSDELGFTYKAHVPAQAVKLDGVNVANVVFTIGWYTGA